jgi:hypothetical protein
MTSSSSSKKEEDLTFAFGDVSDSPSLPVPMLMLQWLCDRCLAFVRTAIKSDWSIWMRNAVGAWACASVAAYVAGSTCGYWLRKTFRLFKND